MAESKELLCPVCRAKQGYQEVCRRCGADLSLLIKALNSIQATANFIEQSDSLQTLAYQDALDYLQWLSPAEKDAAVARWSDNSGQ